LSANNPASNFQLPQNSNIGNKKSSHVVTSLGGKNMQHQHQNLNNLPNAQSNSPKFSRRLKTQVIGKNQLDISKQGNHSSNQTF